MARIVFLQLNYFELHGPQSIAAVIEAHGHQAMFLVTGLEKNPMGELSRFRPDVVGIGHATVERKEALLWAKAIKRNLDCKVVLGGIDPTFTPQLASEKDVDAVFMGESEFTVLEMLNRIDADRNFSDIDGIAVMEDDALRINPMRPLIADLDTLPFPRKDLYMRRYRYFRDYPIKIFMASRGCPYNCTYCANPALRSLYPNSKEYHRFKSSDYLLAEIQRTIKDYPARSICFSDDLFASKMSWLRAFLTRYRDEIGLPFFCTARIDTMSKKKAALLADAGCYICWYGIESASPVTREKLLARKMSNEAIRKGTRILHEHGILTQSYNIMNIPGERFEDGVKTLKLNIELENDFVLATLFQPFPGIELSQQLRKEGKLKAMDRLASRESLSFFAFSAFKQTDTEYFENLQKFFILGHRFPGLLPVIEKLCKLPKNKFFDLIFLLTFAIDFGRLHRLKSSEVFHYHLRNILTTYLSSSKLTIPRDFYR